MRELTQKEMQQVAGGLSVTDLPPVHVRHDPDPLPGGGTPLPDTPPPSGGDSGNRGGGGGGTSKTFGNYSLRNDTLAHRLEIVNLAQADLEKLGYHMPPGYEAQYYDQYAYRNTTTGQLRYADTRELPRLNEVEIAATTQSSDHKIYMFHGAVDPQMNKDWGFSWPPALYDPKTHQPSLTGTRTESTLDGGMSPVQWALATLAHEEYHAMGHFALKNDDPKDPNELMANTYGLMAERAFNKAVIADRK